MRTAAVGDAEVVATLVHSAYRSEESRRGWTTEADLIGGQRADAEMVRGLVTSADGVVLVAAEPADPAEPAGFGDGPADGGRLVACCHLERRGTAAYLGMFAVRPGLQGKGHGRAMLAAAERHAREFWACGRLEITVLNHRPELIAWYERCGFTMTGEQHNFPYGDERYGRPRRSDLVLLEMAKSLELRASVQRQHDAPVPPARGWAKMGP